MGNLQSSRGYFLFFTWARNETSEESNETSEESKRLHVENLFSLRGDFRFSTWVCDGLLARGTTAPSASSVTRSSRNTRLAELTTQKKSLPRCVVTGSSLSVLI